METLPPRYYLVVKNGVVQGTFGSRGEVLRSFNPVVDDKGRVHVLGRQSTFCYRLKPKRDGYTKAEALWDFARTAQFENLARAEGVEVHECIS